MEKPVKIKTCGMTLPQDARLADELGADAIGMILSQVGPRYIDASWAKEIVSSLSSSIIKVGVFVDEPAERVNRLVSELKLDYAQLHGAETPEYCRQIQVPVIKAIKVVDASSLTGLNAYSVAAVLLDGKCGGSGKPFDWGLLSELSHSGFRFLAGGLTPQNVREAIQRVHPDWVDVSSGIEGGIKGNKDREKLKQFIEAVRAED